MLTWIVGVRPKRYRSMCGAMIARAGGGDLYRVKVSQWGKISLMILHSAYRTLQGRLVAMYGRRSLAKPVSTIHSRLLCSTERVVLGLGTPRRTLNFLRDLRQAVPAFDPDRPWSLAKAGRSTFEFSGCRKQFAGTNSWAPPRWQSGDMSDTWAACGHVEVPHTSERDATRGPKDAIHRRLP
jgi:hypothetical protein